MCSSPHAYRYRQIEMDLLGTERSGANGGTVDGFIQHYQIMLLFQHMNPINSQLEELTD